MTDVTPISGNDIIQAYQNVIIEMPSGNAKIIPMKPNTNINLGKFGSFNSDSLIGKPYGLSYEIIGGRKGELRPMGHVSKNTSVEETEANNKDIIDDVSIQKLSHQQVLELKEQGLQGKLGTEEIIQKMVDSHAGFDKKTEYSKAKYIERKKKKFMKVFTPALPSISTIADYFFRKNPDKVRHMRIDTLSQLLALANVHAGNKMLIVDDTQGLIVASVLERMGGVGQVVAVHEGDNHNYDIMRYLNLSKEVAGILQTVPFALVDRDPPNEPFEYLTEEQVAALDEDSLKSYTRRRAAYDTKVTARKALHDGDFDGLIISSALKPESVIKVLMPYLLGSRPVVVYSFNKEVLLSAAYWMRRCNDFLNAELTESFLREHQVLPGRMHPHMNMSAGGGYLLTALRIIDCPFDPKLVKKSDSSDRRSKKKKVEPKKTEEDKVEPKKTEEEKADDMEVDQNE